MAAPRSATPSLEGCWGSRSPEERPWRQAHRQPPRPVGPRSRRQRGKETWARAELATLQPPGQLTVQLAQQSYTHRRQEGWARAQCQQGEKELTRAWLGVWSQEDSDHQCSQEPRKEQGRWVWATAGASASQIEDKPPRAPTGRTKNSDFMQSGAGQPSTSQGAPARKAPTGPLPRRRGGLCDPESDTVPTPRLKPARRNHDPVSGHLLTGSHSSSPQQTITPGGQSPSASPHRPQQTPTDRFLRFWGFFTEI